jgi:hypothetical protein
VIGNKKKRAICPLGAQAERLRSHQSLRDRLSAQKRNSVKPTEETLWRSAMCAETITTNHFKLLQQEKLEPLTASSVRFICWRRPVRIVIAGSSGTASKPVDKSIVACIAPKNQARTA